MTHKLCQNANLNPACTVEYFVNIFTVLVSRVHVTPGHFEMQKD